MQSALKGSKGCSPQIGTQPISVFLLLFSCNLVIKVMCPVFQNAEISMLGEATHLQAIIDDLTVLTTDPHKLPEASEQVL